LVVALLLMSKRQLIDVQEAVNCCVADGQEAVNCCVADGQEAVNCCVADGQEAEFDVALLMGKRMIVEREEVVELCITTLGD
jgi:hypothetical protein